MEAGWLAGWWWKPQKALRWKRMQSKLMRSLGSLKLWSFQNSSRSPLFCSVLGPLESAASDSHCCIADANQYPDYCSLDIVAIVSLHSPFFESEKGWAPYPQQAYLAAWLWPEQSHTQNSTRWTQRAKLRVFYCALPPHKKEDEKLKELDHLQ
jgi:hypothetical protein